MCGLVRVRPPKRNTSPGEAGEEVGITPKVVGKAMNLLWRVLCVHREEVRRHMWFGSIGFE